MEIMRREQQRAAEGMRNRPANDPIDYVQARA
jgi:hypothetical protein